MPVYAHVNYRLLTTNHSKVDVMYRSLCARPRLEILEDRCLPAAISWLHPTNGDWDVASNWSLDRVPTSADQVTISFSDITVSHNQADNDEVASLTSLATLNLTRGSLQINGDSSVQTLHVNGGTLLLTRGMLRVLNFVEMTGTTQLIAGNLASSNPIQIEGGTLIGYGTIGANLVNAGLVQPNNGELTVNGNYTQTSAGTLQETATSPAMNELLVQGIATLAGVLEVSGLKTLPPDDYTDPVLSAVSGHESVHPC